MSETNKPGTRSESDGGVRVNDRRRFDPEGNPRDEREVRDVRADPRDRDAEAERGEASHEHEESADRVAQLEEELSAARRRIDELARALLAGERDREDFKKRLTRERERMLDVEKGNIAVTLLETVDELDLSLKSADDSPFAQGVRMIRSSILSRLGTLGVERVPLEGLPFDPNVAEAMDMEITGIEADDQKVTQELRAAYRLGDRVIRAGRVKVAKYVPPAHA